mmetsp:Transcript_42233/g.67584  ORF Transcript_42233/g.67584 Transcript_42233/m.67584 type:complete len:230 (-) Transcript_42233:558-1247(-)
MPTPKPHHQPRALDQPVQTHANSPTLPPTLPPTPQQHALSQNIHIRRNTLPYQRSTTHYYILCTTCKRSYTTTYHTHHIIYQLQPIIQNQQPIIHIQLQPVVSYTINNLSYTTNNTRSHKTYIYGATPCPIKGPQLTTCYVQPENDHTTTYHTKSTTTYHVIHTALYINQQPIILQPIIHTALYNYSVLNWPLIRSARWFSLCSVIRPRVGAGNVNSDEIMQACSVCLK